MNLAKNNQDPDTGRLVLDKVVQVLSKQYDTFVLGSCWEEECRIVHASRGFVKLTQFSEQQIIGEASSCDFLFGPDTRPEHIIKVHTAVANKAAFKGSLVLYRKSNAHFLLPHQEASVRSNNRSWNQQVKRLTKKLSRNSHKRDKSRAEKSEEFQHPTPSPVIDHNGTFKIMWDWLLMVATFYVGVVTPYNSVFSTDGMYLQPENITGDIIVELLFIADIVINFNTTYHDSFGRLITERKEIARHYIWTWFFFDLLAAIPFDALYFLINYQHKMVVMLKCVRLLRLARLFNILERYSQYSSVILVINMTLYVLLAHWFACVWYMIGSDEYYNGETDWNVDPNRGFMPNKPEPSKLDYSVLYFNALYFSVTMLTTVGFGNESANTVPEKIYVCCGMLVSVNKPGSPLSEEQRYWTAFYFSMTLLTTVGFGNDSANTVVEKIAVCVAMPIFALMHAVVFGNVTAIIQRMYARRFSYDIQANELKDFYRIYNVPKPLKRKIREFYQTVWTVRRGINHEKIVEDFPEDLKADVSMHIYSEFLNHPIFATAPRGCLKAIALSIKTTFVNPEEFVVHSGDVAQYFYFVKNGSLEVFQLEKLTGVIGKSEVFGPDLSHGLGSNGKSGVDVKSVSYCDLHCLPVSDLIESLSLYPEFGVVFAERLSNELSLNLNTATENLDSSVGDHQNNFWEDSSSLAGSYTGAIRRASATKTPGYIPSGNFLTVPYISTPSRASEETSEWSQVEELHRSLWIIQRNMDAMTQQLKSVTAGLNNLSSKLSHPSAR